MGLELVHGDCDVTSALLPTFKGRPAAGCTPGVLIHRYGEGYRGIQSLLLPSLSSCADDALNRAAGCLLHSDRPGFERAVSASVHEGATIEGKGLCLLRCRTSRGSCAAAAAGLWVVAGRSAQPLLRCNPWP